APVLVLVDPDTGKADLLQNVVRFELLAPQPVLVRQKERGKWRAAPDRVEESHQPRTPIELRARDRIVDVDVLRRHREAVLLCATDRQVDLPPDRLLVVGD